MGRIRHLSPDLVTQIAAGEVIDRPVAIVKELVENALDAGATRIQIEVESGGLKKIIVSDNGQGIEAQDIQLSYQPHTTSKLIHNNLHAITTLGFRGEALASIAAVSQVTIASRVASEQVGHQVVVKAGQRIESQPVGMSPGTQVRVESIFHNLPVRQKFFKNPASEWRAILQWITHVVLIYPTVGFSLLHNDKSVLTLPADQALAQRVPAVLGHNLGDHLLPIKYQSQGVIIQGFIGRPQLATAAPRTQFVAVNQRPIHYRELTRTIKAAYGTLLPQRAHPVLIIAVQVPPEWVDVNIHPRKEEVALLRSELIVEQMRELVTTTLQQYNLTFNYSSPQSSSGSVLADRGWSEKTATILKDEVDPWQTNEHLVAAGEVAQIHRLYLVTQTPQGVRIIDQHAAHERILYEQFLVAWHTTAARRESEVLATPLVFTIPPVDAELVAEKSEVVARLGFAIEPFGERTFKVTAVPRMFVDRDIAALVTEILTDQIDRSNSNDVDSLTQRTISYLACRSAIKEGDVLTADQRRALLNKLQQTTSNYTCPHGRPVSVDIDLPELQRMFKRR